MGIYQEQTEEDRFLTELNSMESIVVGGASQGTMPMEEEN